MFGIWHLASRDRSLTDRSPPARSSRTHNRLGSASARLMAAYRWRSGSGDTSGHPAASSASSTVARISGEAVRVGDTVAEYFTVTAIHGRTVELTADGMPFTLDMQDDALNAIKHPGKK